MSLRKYRADATLACACGKTGSVSVMTGHRGSSRDPRCRLQDLHTITEDDPNPWADEDPDDDTDATWEDPRDPDNEPDKEHPSGPVKMPSSGKVPKSNNSEVSSGTYIASSGRIKVLVRLDQVIFSLHQAFQENEGFDGDLSEFIIQHVKLSCKELFGVEMRAVKIIPQGGMVMVPRTDLAAQSVMVGDQVVTATDEG